MLSARHRLSKLLLRHGSVYDEQAWTGRHDAWLRRVRREQLLHGGCGTLAAFDDAYDAVTHAAARRDRLDVAIAALAADSEFTAVTRRLGCLRSRTPRDVGQQREDRTSESAVSTPTTGSTLDLRHATTVQPKQGPAVTNPRISD